METADNDFFTSGSLSYVECPSHSHYLTEQGEDHIAVYLSAVSPCSSVVSDPKVDS